MFSTTKYYKNKIRKKVINYNNILMTKRERIKYLFENNKGLFGWQYKIRMDKIRMLDKSRNDTFICYLIFDMY